MPHFVIDCSENVTKMRSPEEIISTVYKTAESSGLFAEGDIKVRINPFKHYQLGENKTSFLHVFGHIMEGRTTEQKAKLSRSIVEQLNDLLPDLSILSVNISEFELATYCNKAMIHPGNTSGSRHFGLH